MRCTTFFIAGFCARISNLSFTRSITAAVLRVDGAAGADRARQQSGAVAGAGSHIEHLHSGSTPVKASILAGWRALVGLPVGVASVRCGTMAHSPASWPPCAAAETTFHPAVIASSGEHGNDVRGQSIDLANQNLLGCHATYKALAGDHDLMMPPTRCDPLYGACENGARSYRGGVGCGASGWAKMHGAMPTPLQVASSPADRTGPAKRGSDHDHGTDAQRRLENHFLLFSSCW